MAPKDNLSAVLYGINDMRLEQRPIPVPKDNQVLLQMEVVGICGSDVHYLAHGQCGPFILKDPMVIGHEASGTVIQVGKNVKNLKPGDQVAIEPQVPCRTCWYCKTGDYHLCPDIFFCATPPDDGNLSRFYVHEADFCHKLPSNMDLEDGALMEPLSVGVHACKRGNIHIGDVVLILGAGPIGLVTLLSAKAHGASRIIVTDVVDIKLQVAKQLGADFVIKTLGMNEQQIVNKVIELLGEEPTVSIDCTGVEQCVRVALLATRTAGKVVLVGLGKTEMTLPLSGSLVREVDIKGIFRYNNDYPTAIEMVRSGKISVKPLITHHYRLEDTLKAFHTAKTGEGNPIKCDIPSIFIAGMAPKDNLSAVLYGINDMRLEQRPIPVAKDNQVLLQIEVVGICGSDVHYLTLGQCGSFILKDPMVIGHEASGTVIQVGKNVKNLKPGDQVAIEPQVPCRTCWYCKTGDYHLCPDIFFCATPPDDGNLSRFYVHEADFCHKLPPNVDLEDGALMEPMAVGVHACKKGNVHIGDVVLILGAGPIGLVSLLAAKAHGAARIIITDGIDMKLQVAKQLGADFVIKTTGMNEQQIVNKILELLGEEPTVSIDCTGVEQCVRVALLATRTAGKVVLVGIGKTEMNLPLSGSLAREVEIKGVFRYNNDYPTAIEMVRSGKISVKPLITHHYRLEDTLKAFHTAKTGEGNPIKVLIHANPNWKPSLLIMATQEKPQGIICRCKATGSRYQSNCNDNVGKPPNNNLSAVLHGINDMRLVSLNRYLLSRNHINIIKATETPGQVLLQMEVVGICGSDVHFLANGKIGPFVLEKPMVIGHEASGTVVQVGKKVRNLKPGDHVAIEPQVNCRTCWYCKTGNYHLCPDIFFCACPPDDGNLSRFYVHDADFCHKLPLNMDLEDGALLEPLAVGVHACKKGNVSIGDVVLILGAGPIGLVSLLAAKAYGASKVIITDIVDNKLEMAKKLGADFVIKTLGMGDEEMVNCVKECLGEEPTVSIDCVGVEQCVRVALLATRSAGKVVLAGLTQFEMKLPLAPVILREVDVRGVFRYNNDYPAAIEMVRSGKICVKPLITHHYSLEDTLKAFHTAKTKEGNPIKGTVLVVPVSSPPVGKENQEVAKFEVMVIEAIFSRAPRILAVRHLISLHRHKSKCSAGNNNKASKDNLSAVLYGVNDMRLEQRPIPVPKDNQVLLQMEVVGICGSDVHYLVHGKIGPFVLKKPMVIGHEASGTVVEVGKKVKHLKPGDQVAIEPQVNCRTCWFCKTGDYHLCPDIFFCATPPDDGNLSRFYVHDADFCHKLPPNMDLEDGALMEPLAVGVHACKRANIRIGDVVLVLGAGPIGLVSLLTAKAFGASKVIVTDVIDVKLEMAKRLGADCVIKTSDMNEEQIINCVKELLGEDPTVSIECSGAEQSVRVALSVTRTAGKVVLVGVGNFEMKLPLVGAITREVDIRGVFRYANDYPTAIEMVKTGKVCVKPLITHHYTLEDTVKAFHTAKTQEGNPIKILIHPNPNWKPS
ncbi:hypothetical protein NQ315_016968 [Exocentrus adspersus]|uniref:Sorbitol dehydrogenase n=1 Tax=Exocentrus adspersus TaxID=1586481 RepID=A0AAV8VZL7_9CUCU|nr:hypothetical protein NQ315_016968 [Exocentrus adspersus]